MNLLKQIRSNWPATTNSLQRSCCNEPASPNPLQQARYEEPTASKCNYTTATMRLHQTCNDKATVKHCLVTANTWYHPTPFWVVWTEQDNISFAIFLLHGFRSYCINFFNSLDHIELRYKLVPPSDPGLLFSILTWNRRGSGRLGRRALG